MATGARVIQCYKTANNRKRIDIICENYGCFESIINAATIGLKRIIIDEVKDLRHKDDSAELGVRIQNKGMHSDPTCRDVMLLAQLDALADDEKDLFLPYIKRSKTVDDVAADVGIEYKSALQKLRRIKVRIDEANAVYKLNQLCLVNLDIFDRYLETFRLIEN